LGNATGMVANVRPPVAQGCPKLVCNKSAAGNRADPFRKADRDPRATYDVQSKLLAVQVGVTTGSLPPAADAERITEALLWP
jgi:hypothetical protein